MSGININMENVIAYKSTDDGRIESATGNNGAINVSVLMQNPELIATNNLYTTIRTYVHNSDIGADYVTGSEGSLKTKKIYPADASVGYPAYIVTYKYKDSTFPNYCTEETESIGTV